MFATLFNYPSVLARHSEGPAAEERQRFLVHRANQGAARSTLLRTARDLLIIAKSIDVTGRNVIWNHDVEVAAAKWARHQQRRHRSHGPRRSNALFLHLATNWLRFLGRLQGPSSHRLLSPI
jgi:integrase/recombinase XerD